jgi:hypothetical protein
MQDHAARYLNRTLYSRHYSTYKLHITRFEIAEYAEILNVLRGPRKEISKNHYMEIKKRVTPFRTRIFPDLCIIYE